MEFQEHRLYKDIRRRGRGLPSRSYLYGASGLGCDGKVQSSRALVLGVTERHSYRIKARMRKEGVKGVLHGNRGRICQRRLSEKTERRVVELAQGTYRGFNDHHLTEKLKAEEGAPPFGLCRSSLDLLD